MCFWSNFRFAHFFPKKAKKWNPDLPLILCKFLCVSLYIPAFAQKCQRHTNYFNFPNLGSYFIKWQRWDSLLSFIWRNKFYNISRNPWKSMIFMIDECLLWMKCGALHKGIKFSFSSLKEDRIWPRVWNLNVITNFNLEFLTFLGGKS